MSIAGGKGPTCGDMPVYINDLISDGIVALTKQIQVSPHPPAVFTHFITMFTMAS